MTVLFSGLSIPSLLRPFVVRSVVKQVKNQIWMQGMGRHSDEERTDFGFEDLQAMSDFLGSKPFWMGSQISSIDGIDFSFDLSLPMTIHSHRFLVFARHLET
jgi:hypothetical protein